MPRIAPCLLIACAVRERSRMYVKQFFIYLFVYLSPVNTVASIHVPTACMLVYLCMFLKTYCEAPADSFTFLLSVEFRLSPWEDTRGYRNLSDSCRCPTGKPHICVYTHAFLRMRDLQSYACITTIDGSPLTIRLLRQARTGRRRHMHRQARGSSHPRIRGQLENA